MTAIVWAAYNPRRVLPVLAGMALPAAWLVARKVVRR